MTAIICDYDTTVFSHAEILINIKIEDGISKEISDAVVQRFKRHNKLTVVDAGCTVNIKFKHNVPLGNNSWGPFQAHRQVFGLILVAKASTALDVALLHENFHKLKEQFQPLHSRCLIFGIDTNLLKQHSPDVLKFSSLGSWKSYDYDIKEFLTSIFFDLEAKRLKLELEKGIKPPLVKSPLESSKADLDVSDSSERRNYRKKCTGRHLKYLGDISLLAGRISNALLSYHSAIDTLTAIQDSEWIGSALEGLCAVSAIVKFPHPDTNQQLTVNNRNTFKQVLDPRALMNKQSSNSTSLEEIKKLCIPNIENLIDRYKESVINYSRNKNLGSIEMEACIKATRVLITAGKRLSASEFLQNAVYITLNLSEDERIKRYSILANLYADIGFTRKSSFFKRVAAMQCVAPNLTTQNWKECNKLLMKSLNGYNIDLRADNVLPQKGWPSIQTRVFHELIFSAKKMGKNVLANRHTLQFLLLMYPQLSEKEQLDSCNSLQSNANKLSDLHSAKYSSDIYTDTVPCIIPSLKGIKILPLSGVDHPVLVNIDKPLSEETVFLYTPKTYAGNIVNKSQFNWTVNTACTICLRLYNPLEFYTLHLSNLTFFNSEYTKGFECLPIDIDISPKSTKEANLKLLPTTSGKLIINGFKCTIFGINFQCDFDKVPDISTKTIEIDIIPEMPLLYLDPSQNLYRKNTKSCFIEICYGEVYNGSIVVLNTNENIVNFVVTSSKLKLSGGIKVNKSEILQWKSVNKKDLEEKRIFLPFCITPSIKNNCLNDHKNLTLSFEVNVQYSGGEAFSRNWCRNISFTLEANFVECVSIAHAVVKSHEFDDSVCIVELTVKNNLSSPSHICFKSLKGKKYIEEEVLFEHTTTISILIGRVKLWEEVSELNKDTMSLEENLLCYLENLIKPAWKFSTPHGEHRSGKITLLQNSSFSNCITNILYCPVQNLLHSSDINAMKFSPCQPTCLQFLLRNSSKVPISFNVKLYVSQTENKDTQKRNGILFNGKATLTLKDFLPNDSVNFKCSVVFLYRGNYQLRLIYDLDKPTHINFNNFTKCDHITLTSDTYNISVMP